MISLETLELKLKIDRFKWKWIGRESDVDERAVKLNLKYFQYVWQAVKNSINWNKIEGCGTYVEMNYMKWVEIDSWSHSKYVHSRFGSCQRTKEVLDGGNMFPTVFIPSDVWTWKGLRVFFTCQMWHLTEMKSLAILLAKIKVDMINWSSYIHFSALA